MQVTDAARNKIKDLIEKSQQALPDHKLFLRVTVVPGGCSGLKHQTYFDYETRQNDILIRYKEFDLRIDRESHPYLKGATIDYSDTIEKQGFILDNPNSTGSCACGDSFH